MSTNARNFTNLYKFVQICQIGGNTYHSDGVDRVDNCEEENVVWLVIVFSGKKRKEKEREITEPSFRLFY